MNNNSENTRANKLSYPVNDEDLADTELVLELLGGNGHRIEVTETPTSHRQKEKKS